MKIGIIGDIHIGSGYNFGKTDVKTQLNSRLLDIFKTLENIIKEFKKRNVDIVVVTGDVFSAKNPTSAQLNVFSKSLRNIVKSGMQIVIVVGNHDQQRLISTTTIDAFESLDIDNVYVYKDFAIHTLADGSNLVLMPYKDRRMIGSENNDEAVDIIKESLKDLTKNIDGKKIVVGHFMIDKPIAGEDPDSFSINELILPLDTFEDMDCVIMGHVHKHQVISKNPPIMYIGSMDMVTFAERTHKKTSVIIDTKNIDDIEYISNNVKSLFEMKFDYSEGEEYYASKITDMIVSDINKYHSKFNINNAIVKATIKVKDNDLHCVDQGAIKKHIMDKGVDYLMPLQILSMSVRQKRNKKITEDVSSRKAMESFIDDLKEPDHIKKQLIKVANELMKD